MTFTTLCWLSFWAISEPIRSGAVQKRVRLKSHQLMVCIKEGQASLVGVPSDVTFGVIQLFSRSAWEMRSITTVDWACSYAHVTWSYGHFHSHKHGYNGCKYVIFLGGLILLHQHKWFRQFQMLLGFQSRFRILAAQVTTRYILQMGSPTTGDRGRNHVRLHDKGPLDLQKERTVSQECLRGVQRPLWWIVLQAYLQLVSGRGWQKFLRTARMEKSSRSVCEAETWNFAFPLFSIPITKSFDTLVPEEGWRKHR